MLKFVRGKVSDRKLRLFACGCCRQFWHLMDDDRSRKAIEVAEQFADGFSDNRELHEAWESLQVHRARPPLTGKGWDIAQLTAALHGLDAAVGVIYEVSIRQWVADKPEWRNIPSLAGLLRDIFHNPFRSVTVDATWLTMSASAQAIYDERSFDRMPILADALEDAGCASQDILNHCRQPGVHVRGCWVVDLLLDKE